jgi:hypothetical protein
LNWGPIRFSLRIAASALSRESAALAIPCNGFQKRGLGDDTVTLRERGNLMPIKDSAARLRLHTNLPQKPVQ